ncbi:MAG: biotin/lipoyl-binding protein [Rikenellaceae bacterium]|jgi:biotin carboxyl carrier protein|nr:biotin/lipoyl-binding protein [Rikenellaceae bacterium]
MKVYKYKINGNDYTVQINSVEGDQAEVTVNDAVYNVTMEAPAPANMPKPTPAAAAVPSTDTHPSVARTASPAATAATAAGVKSPLPGVILQLLVAPGDSVKVGQRLLVLEAMKMENNIDSDRDGVVKSINVRQGDSVLEGDVLLTIG